MMVMRRTRCFCAGFLLWGCHILPASAVYLTSLVFDIASGKHFISRPVVNDTDHTNLYGLSVYRIDKPGKGGENKITTGDREVLFTPLRFLLKEGGKEYFKLHYRGQQDDVERYYRVVFREAPAQMFPWRDSRKNLNVLPVTALSAVLIVRPGKMRFNYTLDEKKGLIRNSGNTYFRVIIQKGCQGTDEDATQFYMLPGETWQHQSISVKNRKFIVGPNGYVRLGNGCFDAE